MTGPIAVPANVSVYQQGKQGLPGVGSAAFQASHSYVVGDIVQHSDGTWLRCVVAYTSGSSIDLTKFEPVNGVPALEAVPVTVFGDSYAALDITGMHGPVYRIAKRHRTQDPVNKAVSHTTYAQNFTAIKSGWTPGTSGLVWFSGTAVNDMVAYYPAAGGPSTGAESFRACLALLSAADLTPIVEASGASVTYGPGWTSGTSDGTANRYADVAWTGTDCYVLLSCVTTTGATVEFRDSTNTAVATFTTGGYAGAFTGAVKMPTLSSSTHTLRMVVTSGAATLVGICPQLTTPPPILWDKPGMIPLNTLSYGGDATLRSYVSAAAAVAATFSNVIPADSDTSGWNSSTMITADSTHRNDRGNRFAANIADAALRSRITDFLPGLNTSTYYTAGPTYTRPTPSYSRSGATVPATPGSFTASAGNQVSFTWTRPDDGGATLTGFVIESSPAGAGTWTTLATITDRTATSWAVTTGLTATSSYDFRIKATNSVGNSTVSATSTATAGSSPVIYSADTFTRADSLSMGSTETGGLAWAAKNSGGFNISTNNALFVSGTSTFSSLVVNDGASDGTFKCTATRWITGGIIFAADSTANTGYCVSNSNGNYALNKRTAVGAYTLLGTSSGITAAIGDSVKVIKNGSSIKVYINGTLRITATDATYNGTYHGPFGITVNDRWDDWYHDNSLV